jgi:Tfp pilus assembly protein PilN
MALALLLFGHYGYMKHKEGLYKDRIRELSAELKERKARIAEYESLIKEEAQVQEKIAFAKKRLDYVSGQIRGDLSDVIDCLSGIAAAVSEDIVLSEIVQQGDNVFAVTGAAFDPKGVGRFTTELQAMSWCKAVVLKKLERAGNPSSQHMFELMVTTGQERKAP